MASISAEYSQIGERLATALGKPYVIGLYLPDPVPDETFRDEFGFVFLADGSIGPFYVSMLNILQRLWRRYPDPHDCRLDPLYLLQGFSDSDPARRALALGTYNALSAALFRASGFEPPDRQANSGLTDTPTGGQVGMVGYFCPLVDKLTSQGHAVLVLEHAPERVPKRVGVSVTRNPCDLQACKWVICTASTLINDSLEAILACVGAGVRVELVGPSGSGVPDPLFARGVAAVGGIIFSDRQRLIEHLNQSESWGTAGRKYELDPATYPGLEQLLETYTQSDAQRVPDLRPNGH
jgi:uncharacterized protein (DUF4213/DUF364 family)